MNVKQIQVKSILTKSKLPGADYVINPYVGCPFACVYCYATFMGRFSGHVGEEWGKYLDVKINAPEILRKELENLESRILNKKEKPNSTILFGSITDPYHGFEAKYQITNKCLEVIAESKAKADISILTKSPLVTRDIDLLKKIQASVGLTITSTDDAVSKLFEANAPIAGARLDALKKLNDAGIDTYVCINPLLPHYVAYEQNLRKLFTAIRDAGTKNIWLEHLNLSGKKLEKMREKLKTVDPDAVKYFEESQTDEYKMKLNILLFKILEDYDFTIEGGGIIDHKKKLIIKNKKLRTLKARNAKDWRIEVMK